jgi:F-type H+-transporting ATPase subunit epsilon
MKKILHLNIVDSHNEIFHGEITDVTVSGTMGGLTFLVGHAPLISSLKPGEIHYSTPDGAFESLFVSGGIVEVQPTLVTILADTIIRSEEWDATAAQESIERAKQEIKIVEIGSKAHEELLREMQIMKTLLELSRVHSRLGIKRY